MRKRIEHDACYVLHTYPYKETSLIVEMLSRQCGRIALVARGARRPRSTLRGQLLAFQALRATYAPGTEIGTLVALEWAGGIGRLSGTRLMSGFYLNELLLRLLPREDAHEALFDHYAVSLKRLAAGDPPSAVLRAFERRMLAELGYAPLLEREAETGAAVEPEREYRYDPDHGPVALAPAADEPGASDRVVVSGRTLLDLARDDYTRLQTREQARALMRALIGHRLGDRVLNTRAILQDLQDL